MKQLKTCLVCNKPVAKNLTYQVSVEKFVENPMTGELKKVEIQGHLCPICNQRSGYKTSKDKLRRFCGEKRSKVS